MSWKVTIWRIGGGGGYTAEGRTIRDAYARALSRAGEPYLTGLSGADGHRYGPDITERLGKCFAIAAKAIRHKRTCPRCEVTDEWRAVIVQIARVR